MSLLDVLSAIGDTFDAPGAYTRGMLEGRPGEKASWGTVGDMLVNPLNLIPMMGAYRTLASGGKLAEVLGSGPLWKKLIPFADDAIAPAASLLKGQDNG